MMLEKLVFLDELLDLAELGGGTDIMKDWQKEEKCLFGKGL